MADIEKMNLASKDLVAERIEQLKTLFPEIVTEPENSERERERESHCIDFEKLRLLLGDEVDEGQERYAFTWPGKTDAIRQSQTVSAATLRPCPEKSRGRDGRDGSFDSDNIYIEGDNLEVLKLLQRGYHGKVKMIYIDPPYNTGHDFVYHDSFGDTIENYKQQAGLTGQSNADTSGRFHSDWCSMMYPRLKLARELLKDDGVIFISIDDNEYSNIKKVCDEVYGETNCLSTIIWQRKRGRDNSAKWVSKSHEYLLIYAKNSNLVLFNRLDLDEETKKAYRNPDEDERGPYRLLGCWARGTQGGSRFEFKSKDGHFFTERLWLCSEDSLRKLDEEDKLVFRGDNVYRKLFLFENPGKIAESIWSDVSNAANAADEIKHLFGKIVFDTPKPLPYIMQMLRMATSNKEDAIILDFFSGSAATAHAAMNVNLKYGGKRQFILVQIPERAAGDSQARKAGYSRITDIGEERIRRAGDKIKSELEESNSQLKLGEEPRQLPDIGFRVFKLDDSGIDRPKPEQLLLDVVKPDRTELDIVFEMMLKWGLELTLPVERASAAGYPIWSVACDELVCCMSQGLTMDALEAIADREPRRVLILDSVLDDTLKLNAVQIFKHAGERMGSEIELRTV